MHDTAHAKNGKPSSTSTVRPTTAGQTKGPRLHLFMGQAKPKTLDPELLLDATDWTALATECQDADGQILFDIRRLPEWPDEPRYQLLRLVTTLDGRARLRIRKQEFNDLFEAVLTAMVGPTCLRTHQRSLRAAIEAAALCYPDMAEQAAARINQRLAAVGAAKMNCQRLAKQIREVAGKGGNPAELMQPESAARAFLEEARTKANLPEDRPVVHYYRSEFYVWREGEHAWERTGDDRFAALVMQFLQSRELAGLDERMCRNVLAHLRALTMLGRWDETLPFFIESRDPFQISRPWWLVFTNGVLDLAKAVEDPAAATLEPVDSRYFNTVKLPYDFDPKAKCPLWQETLKQILPRTSPDDRRRMVLQEFTGYTLASDCRFEKCLVLCGRGGNGKSTVVEPWQAMLGADNYSRISLEDLGKQFRNYQLLGKLANFSGEMSYLGKIQEGMLKPIISGEEIDADRKFKDPIKFRPQAKIVVNTNELPQIQDPTEGMWDRLIIVPFERRIRGTAMEDPLRKAQLLEELPGIVNWALRGLARLLNNGRFSPCCKCEALHNRHRTESDTARMFIQECCEQQAGWKMFSEPLYQFYRYYAIATGHKPVSSCQFGKRMRAQGWLKVRETTKKRRLYYRDMRLSPAGESIHGRALEKGILTDVLCRGPGQD